MAYNTFGLLKAHFVLFIYLLQDPVTKRIYIDNKMTRCLKIGQFIWLSSYRTFYFLLKKRKKENTQ